MAHLSICALGPLQIMLDEQPITALAYDKVWALLIYLALAADRPQRREALAGLLWPDQPEDGARTSLRQALARLRQAIGDRQATPPFLLIERESIQFNQASHYTFDAVTWLTLLATCNTHEHRRAVSCTVCAQQRAAAMALYRGHFLDKFFISDSDLFEEWAVVTREAFHQQALGSLTHLANHYEQRGDYAEALRVASRQLALDPWHEEAHRQMMRVLALNGQRSAALAQYKRCRAILAAELQVTPAAETTALYTHIRDTENVTILATGHLALPAARPHNLPLQPTPFLGREQELTTLADLLVNPTCRLLTLLGPGGIGKTRLALQVATEQLNTFAQGVTFVALASLNSAALLAPTIAAAFNLTLTDRAELQTQLLNYLCHKELLLVLDNFEHILAGTTLIAEILQQAPQVSLLVTSRERLNLQSEWLFDVTGLAIPPANLELTDKAAAGQFERYSAVALFLQHARRVQRDFVPTAADKAAILRICHVVQGMPLALELAAAWVRVLSCAEIAAEIEQGLSLLATTQRDVPVRHRSLQAVFDHSWKLLTPDEQRVFAYCAVFRGGFTREAVTQVAGATLPILAALVDKSLLRRTLDGRYLTHELARQYAAARLEEVQATLTARQRHLNCFTNFAEEAERQMLAGQQQLSWLARLEVEHDNLRAALDWALADGDFTLGLRMVGALWDFWLTRGYASEGAQRAEQFLIRTETAERTAARAKALHTAGALLVYQGRFQSALVRLTEGNAIARELGPTHCFLLAMLLIAEGYAHRELHDLQALEVLSQESLMLGQQLQSAWIKGHAIKQLGVIAHGHRDCATAQQRLLESFTCFQSAGHHMMKGVPLRDLGGILREQGDWTTAHTYLMQSLAIFREVDDQLKAAGTLSMMGDCAMLQGNFAEAEHRYTEALAIQRELHQQEDIANTLEMRGRLAQQQNEYERAKAFYQESLILHIELDNFHGITYTLEAFAGLAAVQGQAERAVQLFGATEMFFHKMGTQLNPILRPQHDKLVAVTCAQLGETRFTSIWAVGATLTLDEAVTLVFEKQW